MVHRELKKLPHDTDRHREAESDKSQIARGKVEDNTVVFIEQHDHRKADRGGKKSVQCVKHRIPDRYCSIIAVDFPENFRSVYKTIDDNLQGLGKSNPEPDFDHAWQKEKNQSEYTEHKGLEIAQHELTDHRRYDKQTQDGVHDKRPPVFSKLFYDLLEKAFPSHAPVQLSDLSFLTSILIQMK